MFPKLPEELNELIVSCLDLDDRQTLTAVCCTNRLGRRLATPLMYRHVGATEHGKGNRDMLLCRTLLENPQLCQYVEKINLLHYSEGNPSDPSIKSDVSKLLLDLHTQTRLPFYQSFLEWLSLGCDVYVSKVMLMVLAYNAQVIHIRGNHQFLTWQKLLDTTIAAAVEARDTGATPPKLYGFTKIHTVKISNHLAQLLPDVRDLCVLLALPALQNLEIESLAASPDMHLGMESRGPSTVQSLVIRDCRAKADTLTGLFRLTPDLRRLSIRWSSRHDNYWRTDWRRIGRALTTLTPALEHLEFTHPIDDNFGVDQRESQGIASGNALAATLAPLGSLKSLKSLQTLILSTIALFGQHQTQDWPELDTVLPGSVEKLELLAKDIYLVGNDRLIVTDPYISRLQNFIIYNCQKDRWITKDGEGALPPKRPLRIFT
ncbi:hypothetical protein AC578_7673 [Pseudocercospora eumusae]|uniref:F-box domain-containing protein n=1 Tax=Pseudocercospora eumusae TaxID=321146 RepID=A0A139GVC7_9PEZI|nr:hypothetical protein AC578_7673 [Pseudocercospora eumusae]KXS94158.1 hypothetical protein AC578_7673 [Pseudocercospora eumusae]KXS94159.1 hypothetical protein AC578_7673 [Pseudocercospora eumusae]